MKVFLALAIGLFAGTSFGFDFDGQTALAKVAYGEFVANHADMVPHFTGYKVWNSDDDAMVVIYMTHDGMNMQYKWLCHVHETGPECHAQ